MAYHGGMAKPAQTSRPELTRLRHEAGLTQQQLAEALGLKSARAIKAWETGAYAPSMSYALPLARVLGVPVEDVVEAVAGPDAGDTGAADAGAAAPGQARAVSSPRRRDDAGGQTRVPREAAAISHPGALPTEMLAALTFHIEELAHLVERIQEAPSTAAPDEPEAGNPRIEEHGAPAAHETARETEHPSG